MDFFAIFIINWPLICSQSYNFGRDVIFVKKSVKSHFILRHSLDVHD